ncbi:MAG: hypothetical protein M3552_08485 [Planctomycetota bacterium]|nr:hypothetical protein [Planctomycetaceae bacterium]MDQ3330677.1 hypothetical protein [Planctomycetota bacterium]
MRAAETPQKDRAASISTRLLGLAVVTVAITTGSTLDQIPGDVPLKPGAVVSYCEDRLGRPWTILRQVGHQTFEVRNGGVDVIVEAKDLSPYRGYATSITVGMAGLHWRDEVAEVQRTERLEYITQNQR